MASKNPSQSLSDPTQYVYCTLLSPNYAEPEDSPECIPFMVHISAQFTLSDDPENYSVTYSRAFPLSAATLSDKVEARRAIAWMLSEMRVVPEDYMVEEILDNGHRMMMSERTQERDDLVCRVDIEIVVDELPLPPEDDCQEQFSVEELRLRLMETTKELIDGSQSETAATCSVCFEDFSVRCEATRLPCSHLYHGSCIQKWFRKSKFCPLCRFQMAC